MHTQAKGKGKRSRYRKPTAAEVAVLRLLSEQGAMPLDQLARFIEVDFGRALSVVQGLEEAGCIEYRRYLVKDYPWFWPSWRGLQFAATGFKSSAPVVSSLAHRRGINDVCLYLRARAPQGTWICERMVRRIRDPLDHLPDAVFEIEVEGRKERHAIEVELSCKKSDEILEILAEHSDRYDAVVYFCGQETHSFMERVKKKGNWPKLVVRHLSEASDETVP
jgi:DNA-binding Lrp family transcriptional regulator